MAIFLKEEVDNARTHTYIVDFIRAEIPKGNYTVDYSDNHGFGF